MNKTVIIITALSLAISCKEVKKTDSTQTVTKSEPVEQEFDVQTSLELDYTWVNNIVLNEGKKWQANKETTDGVNAMLKSINEATTSTTSDYIKLGDRLNDIKNTVIKECTMEGASHDNLHIWLHSLIEKIELLQKVENTEVGKQITSNIEKHLEGYYNFFY